MAILNERLAAVKAPHAVMEQGQACASTAPTALAERAPGDLWWGASTLIGVAVGMTDARMIVQAPRQPVRELLRRWPQFGQADGRLAAAP